MVHRVIWRVMSCAVVAPSQMAIFLKILVQIAPPPFQTLSNSHHVVK